MDGLDHFEKSTSSIEDKIGYVFQDKKLLLLAFTHRSFVNEAKGKLTEHNERLEFLGDAIFGFVVADYLYRKLPSDPEGKLSLLRSKIVDAFSCAQYLQQLGLASYILLGRGERMSEGTSKISILADVFEALVAALYLDGGIAGVNVFLTHHFEKEFERVLGAPPRNYKAELQEYVQKNYHQPPVYKVVEETGPDHAKEFRVVVSIQNQDMGEGVGFTKKEAEQMAALDAISKGIGQKNE